MYGLGFEVLELASRFSKFRIARVEFRIEAAPVRLGRKALEAM